MNGGRPRRRMPPTPFGPGGTSHSARVINGPAQLLQDGASASRRYTVPGAAALITCTPKWHGAAVAGPGHYLEDGASASRRYTVPGAAALITCTPKWHGAGIAEKGVARSGVDVLEVLEHGGEGVARRFGADEHVLVAVSVEDHPTGQVPSQFLDKQRIGALGGFGHPDQVLAP